MAKEPGWQGWPRACPWRTHGGRSAWLNFSRNLTEHVESAGKNRRATGGGGAKGGAFCIALASPIAAGCSTGLESPRVFWSTQVAEQRKRLVRQLGNAQWRSPRRRRDGEGTGMARVVSSMPMANSWWPAGVATHADIAAWLATGGGPGLNSGRAWPSVWDPVTNWRRW